LISEDLQQHLPGLEKLRIASREPSSALRSGRRPGLAKGSGVEFADYRKYEPGDDTRHIDWHIYARSRKLFVRQYRAEVDLNIHLLLDTSGSMSLGRPGKLKCAAMMAAALAYVGLGKLDRVGLATFTDRVQRRLPPGRGLGSLFRLLRLLGEISPGGETDLGQVLRRYGRQAKTRGLVIVLSDFLGAGDYQEGLEYLLYKRFDVALIQVLAEEDLEPELEGRVELEDAELKSRSLVDEISTVDYCSRLMAHNRALADFCRSRGLPCVQAKSSISFEDLTFRFLDAGLWRAR